jgi:hypothetical protein
MVQPETSIDWEYEKENQTDAWQRQCEVRWATARRLIGMGYSLCWLRPLSKAYASSVALERPIRNAHVLAQMTDPGGEYRDFNYGIICGCGTVTFLDFDIKTTKDGTVKDGLAFYRELAARQGESHIWSTSVTLTPSGGQHHAFAYDERFNRQSPWGKKGIDIQNSDGARPTRHVVGPGSVVWDNGVGGVYLEDDGSGAIVRGETNAIPRPYVSPQELPPIPEGILEAFIGDNKVVSIHGGPAPSFGRHGRGTDTVEEDVTVEMAEEMLEKIDVRACHYDDWLRVGMALHHWNEVDGFELWRKWSETDAPERYDFKRLQSAWDSFSLAPRGRAPVTIASVCKMAYDNGYSGPDCTTTLSLYEEYNIKHPLIAADVEHVYRMRDGRVITHSEDKLKKLLVGERHWTTVKGKRICRFDQYLEWPNRTIYDKHEMWPPRSKNDTPGYGCPPHIYNTWSGYALEPKKNTELLAAYLELFRTMFPDPAQRKWFNTWLCALVQGPGTKPGTAPVLCGKQGTGKDMLMSIFRRMFKSMNSVVINHVDRLTSKFNDSLTNRVLVIANEAHYSGNHRHANLLKDYITNDDFDTEEKNRIAISKHNCMKIMLMTNDRRAAPVERSDRRYAVFEVPLVRPPGDAYWGEMKDRINHNDEFIQAVMYHYMEMGMTKQDWQLIARAPESADRAAVQRQHLLEGLESKPKDKQCLAVITNLLRKGKAAHAKGTTTKTRHGESVVVAYDGYALSSEMVCREHRHVTGLPSMDWNFITFLAQWFEKELEIAIVTGVKKRIGGTQKQSIILPSAKIVAEAISDFLGVPLEEIDYPDEWTEEGLDDLW